MSSKSGKRRSSSKSSAVPEPPSKPRLCRMVRADNGYGFNLHSKQGAREQFIQEVDAGSPAEKANLKKGDRVISVNGINIERETHAQVVARIKSGGDRTELLVVDRELDMYNKKYEVTVEPSTADESQFIENENSVSNETDEAKVNGDAVPAENGVSLTPVVIAAEVATEESSPPERIEEPVAEEKVEMEESVPVESVPNDMPNSAEEAEVIEETATQPDEDAVEPEVVVAVAANNVESTPEPVREPSPEPESSPERESKKAGLDLSDMAKARALAAGKKKKKDASSADWKSKYNAFQNLE